MKNFGNVSLGKISNVCIRGGDASCYFCKVELSLESEPTEVVNYVARGTDIAETGQWVYQQIIDGNFEGELADLAVNVDPFTREILVDPTNERARLDRDKRLAITDWTQMPDVSQATKDKWAPYRQALRDVPQQAGFPDTIVWPTAPQ
jgi:hypothetical protein